MDMFTYYRTDILMSQYKNDYSWPDRVALTLSGLDLPLSSHPLQSANCCRNSRLVADEDDLMWVKN